jgi:hypothetical protein
MGIAYIVFEIIIGANTVLIHDVLWWTVEVFLETE